MYKKIIKSVLIVLLLAGYQSYSFMRWPFGNSFSFKPTLLQGIGASIILGGLYFAVAQNYSWWPFTDKNKETITKNNEFNKEETIHYNQKEDNKNTEKENKLLTINDEKYKKNFDPEENQNRSNELLIENQNQDYLNTKNQEHFTNEEVIEIKKEDRDEIIEKEYQEIKEKENDEDNDQKIIEIKEYNEKIVVEENLDCTNFSEVYDRLVKGTLSAQQLKIAIDKGFNVFEYDKGATVADTNTFHIMYKINPDALEKTIEILKENNIFFSEKITCRAAAGLIFPVYNKIYPIQHGTLLERAIQKEREKDIDILLKNGVNLDNERLFNGIYQLNKFLPHCEQNVITSLNFLKKYFKNKQLNFSLNHLKNLITIAFEKNYRLLTEWQLNDENIIFLSIKEMDGKWDKTCGMKLGHNAKCLQKIFLNPMTPSDNKIDYKKLQTILKYIYKRDCYGTPLVRSDILLDKLSNHGEDFQEVIIRLIHQFCKENANNANENNPCKNYPKIFDVYNCIKKMLTFTDYNMFINYQ